MARSKIIGKIDLMSPTQKVYLSEEQIKKLGSFRQSISKILKTKFYDLPKDWRKRKKNIRMLFDRFSDYFEYWYYPGLLDINEWSLSLASLGSKHFEDWWDPNQFDWKWIGSLAVNNRKYFTHWYDPSKISKDRLSTIANNCSDHFEVWWDKDSYPIDGYSSLIWNCLDHIEKWWDPDIIFKDPSNYTHRVVPRLLECCKDHFDLWWNPELYNYEHFDPKFLEFAPEHFYKWFDKDKIPDEFWTSYSWMFAHEVPELFDEWFDKAKFNYGINRFTKYRSVRRILGRQCLIQFCSDHFHKWWDKRRIRATRENLNLMEKHCYEHRGDWGADFIVLELQEEGGGDYELTT